MRPAGIEPAAYSLGGYRSIQLSYERVAPLVGALFTHVKYEGAEDLRMK